MEGSSSLAGVQTAWFEDHCPRCNSRLIINGHFIGINQKRPEQPLRHPHGEGADPLLNSTSGLVPPRGSEVLFPAAAVMVAGYSNYMPRRKG
jgi:hypothetical protein